MLIVLKGTSFQGEECQEFLATELATARGIAEEWKRKGWRPRLLVKSYDGRFTWLTSQSGQRKAA
jgi:hypothetical protein